MNGDWIVWGLMGCLAVIVLAPVLESWQKMNQGTQPMEKELRRASSGVGFIGIGIMLAMTAMLFGGGQTSLWFGGAGALLILWGVRNYKIGRKRSGSGPRDETAKLWHYVSIAGGVGIIMLWNAELIPHWVPYWPWVNYALLYWGAYLIFASGAELHFIENPLAEKFDRKAVDNQTPYGKVVRVPWKDRERRR